jgi:hypothetical protein
MEEIHFRTPGKENTEMVLRIAKEYAEKNNIRNIIIASTTGYTANRAAEILSEFKLVIITHSTGFSEPNHQEFPKDLEDKLESEGIQVLTTAHALGGINQLLENSLGEIIKRTLRIFCQGVKVAVEISTMAVDAGLIRNDEDCLTVTGTGNGADTLLLIQPASSSHLFDLKVKKILAKPIHF